MRLVLVSELEPATRCHSARVWDRTQAATRLVRQGSTTFPPGGGGARRGENRLSPARWSLHVSLNSTRGNYGSRVAEMDTEALWGRGPGSFSASSRV